MLGIGVPYDMMSHGAPARHRQAPRPSPASASLALPHLPSRAHCRTRRARPFAVPALPLGRFSPSFFYYVFRTVRNLFALYTQCNVRTEDHPARLSARAPDPAPDSRMGQGIS